MNRNIVIAVAAAVLVLLFGWFMWNYSQPKPVHEDSPLPAPAEHSPTTTDSGIGELPAGTAPTTGAKKVTITYTDSGFSPKDVTIPIGSTVTWINQSSEGMWVASDNHPTHTLYDGTSRTEHCAAGASASFDECVSAAAGGTYSFTFTKIGSFTFHNHMDASQTGTVTVTK